MLTEERPAHAAPRLDMLDELLRRADATGLAVSCRFLRSRDRLSPAVSEASYRLVQEAITKRAQARARGARRDHHSRR